MSEVLIQKTAIGNMPNWADDGIEEHSCLPSTLVDDYGFILLTGKLYTSPPSIEST